MMAPLYSKYHRCFAPCTYRFIAVFKPFDYKVIATKKRCILSVVVMWMMSIAVSSLPVAGWRCSFGCHGFPKDGCSQIYPGISLGYLTFYVAVARKYITTSSENICFVMLCCCLQLLCYFLWCWCTSTYSLKCGDICKITTRPKPTGEITLATIFDEASIHREKVPSRACMTWRW